MARPLKPLTAERRALLDAASPEVRRTLAYVAETILLAETVSPRRVWSMYWFGSPGWSRPDDGMPGTRATLEMLRPYGVRWAVPLGTPPGVDLIRPVYQLLRPAAVESLTCRGLYPPLDRGGKTVHWRGPKRGTR